jgi:uncharacterized membrane protein YoaK (UPF0700 family)
MMSEDQLRGLESLPPLTADNLPTTLPPRMKSKTKKKVAWWAGFVCLIITSAFCLGVVAPTLMQNQLNVIILGVMLTFIIGMLFFVTYPIIK